MEKISFLVVAEPLPNGLQKLNMQYDGLEDDEELKSFIYWLYQQLVRKQPKPSKKVKRLRGWIGCHSNQKNNGPI